MKPILILNYYRIFKIIVKYIYYIYFNSHFFYLINIPKLIKQSKNNMLEQFKKALSIKKIEQP